MITVVGEALVDIIVDPSGEVTSVVGGGPLNTARTIARLGLPVSFLGGVSADAFGGRIMRLLEQDGVHYALGERLPEPTTLAIASIDASGAATYRFMLEGTSAAAVTPQAAVAVVPGECRAVHVGTLGLVLQPLADATVAVVQAAGPEQIVMVDPNCRPSVMGPGNPFARTLEQVLARADIVKVSGDDLQVIFPELDAVTAARKMQQDCGAVVLFTDGAEAVRIVTAEGIEVIEVPKVAVLDTVGAGDSFSGGFLAHWLSGNRGRADLGDLEAIVAATRYGIAVAGITCQRAGADPPYAHEVRLASLEP